MQRGLHHRWPCRWAWATVLAVVGVACSSSRDDRPAPRVVLSRPASGELDVRPSPLVTLVFSHPVQRGPGELFFSPGPLRAIPERWTEGDRVVSFSLPGSLPWSTMVRGLARGFVTTDGRPVDTFRFSFSTVAEPPGPVAPLAPRVLAVDPPEGATGVAPSLAEMTLTFSEPMDPSVISLAVDVFKGLGVPLAVPVVYLDGGRRARLRIDGALALRTAYSVDLRSLRSPDGRHIGADDPVTRDGFADFRTRGPTGESCAEPLELADGTTMDGRTVVRGMGGRGADGGAASCHPEGPGRDAVVRIDKGTPGLAEGGTALWVSVRADGGPDAPPLAVEIVHGDACAPARRRHDPGQALCVAGRPRWDRTLEGDPGTYWVFVAGPDADAPMPPFVLETEERPAGAIGRGEGCGNPLREGAPGFDRPAPGVRRWTLSEDAMNGYELARSWGPGSGALSCNDDPVFGDRPGVDAVIAFDKRDPSTLLRITSTSPMPGAAHFELFAGGCTRLEADAVLGCGSVGTPGDAGTFVGGVGVAGPMALWVAADRPGRRFPEVVVTVEEIDGLAPGDACGRGILLEPGDNPVARSAGRRLGAPSCFEDDADVLWFEVRPTTNATVLRVDGADRHALVDAASGDELSCKTRPVGPALARIADAGTTTCLAVEGGGETRNIHLTEVAYAGPGANGARPVDFEMPIRRTGFPVIFSEAFLAADDERAWLGEGASGRLLEIAWAGGSTRVRDGDTDGLSDANASVALIVTDAGLFGAGSSEGSTSHRVFRLWDRDSPDGWVPEPWDAMPAYPFGDGIRDLAFDGTDLVVLVSGGAGGLLAVPETGGVPTTLPAARALPPGADALVATPDDLVFVEVRHPRIGRLPRGGSEVLTAVMASPEGLVLTTDLVLVEGSPDILLFRGRYFSGPGIHVIEDPVGPRPRYLGRIVETAEADVGLTVVHDTDEVALYDTLEGGVRHPRLVRLW